MTSAKLSKREIARLVEDSGDMPNVVVPRATFNALVAGAKEAAPEPKRAPYTPVENLGDLIRGLELQEDPDKFVFFDVCRLNPTTFGSYRGIYHDLALGYSALGYYAEDKDRTNVGKLLAFAKAAVGKDFESWKSGPMTMSMKTKLWVANQGETGDSRRIVGVRDEDWCIVLKTKSTDDEDA